MREQHPVRPLRKRRVGVARRRRRNADPVDLDQLQADTAGAQVASATTPSCRASRPPAWPRRGRRGAGGRAPGWARSRRRPRAHGWASKRSSSPTHAQPLHLRVRLQEPPPEEEQPALQRRAREGERLAVDEVLHRVRGDDVGVVAFGVGGRECLAHHLDVDLRGQQDVVRTAHERRLGDGPTPRQRAWPRCGRSRPPPCRSASPASRRSSSAIRRCLDRRRASTASSSPPEPGPDARPGDGDDVAQPPLPLRASIRIQCRLQQGHDRRPWPAGHEDDVAEAEARLVRVVEPVQLRGRAVVRLRPTPAPAPAS